MKTENTPDTPGTPETGQPDFPYASFYKRHPQWGRVLAGIFWLGVGIVLLLNALNFPMPEHLFTWPVLVMCIGFYVGAKHGFRGPGWLITLGVGAFFYLNDLYPGSNYAEFIAPVLVIGAALLIIFRRPDPEKWERRKWERFTRRQGRSQFGYDAGAYQNKFTAAAASDGGAEFAAYPKPDAAEDKPEFLNLLCIFSGQKKKVFTNNFKGADINAIFGGAEVNLMDADIKGSVVVNINAICGGVKIIIPAHWNLHSDLDCIMGGMDDKRHLRNGRPDPDKTLILRGSAIMGGVEVQSY